MISAVFKNIMPKQIAEHSNALRINWLKKQGILDGGFRSGTITWTFKMSENKSSIGYSALTGGDDEYINLCYTQTDNHSGEKTDLDYKVPLVSTPCNYGGKRYWFRCSLSKNGKFCGRRIGVLFLIGKHFGCRYCGDIAYYSQMQSEKYKGFVSIPDIEEAEKKVKRYYYKGKPTKKHRRLEKLNNKFHLQMIKMASRLDSRFKRIVDLSKK